MAKKKSIPKKKSPPKKQAKSSNTNLAVTASTTLVEAFVVLAVDGESSRPILGMYTDAFASHLAYRPNRLPPSFISAYKDWSEASVPTPARLRQMAVELATQLPVTWSISSSAPSYGHEWVNNSWYTPTVPSSFQAAAFRLNLAGASYSDSLQNTTPMGQSVVQYLKLRFYVIVQEKHQ